MSVRYERTEYLAYAICQIACSTNEDRFYANMTHAVNGVESIASFGVFDGHLGVMIFSILKPLGTISFIGLSINEIVGWSIRDPCSTEGGARQSSKGISHSNESCRL